MSIRELRQTKFNTDARGFLRDPNSWTEEFAVSVAPAVGLPDGLTQRHWQVIMFIREVFEQSERCPLLFEVCRANDLKVEELQRLFPSGYLRGVCRLAGITYREGYLADPCPMSRGDRCPMEHGDRTYRIDVHGFLVEPEEWDETFAQCRAQDMGMAGGLTAAHWRVLTFLRDRYAKTGEVPTLYSVCAAMRLSIHQLEQLFPSGYHRGAVKLAGLRVR